MNKKWTWSKMLLAAAAVALLISGSTLFAAKGGGGKPPKDDPPPPPAELPDVRYEIKFIELPANATGTPSPYVNEINNLGQVVGNYSAEDGERAFFFDGVQAIDLNAIVTAGLPDGWRLRSALAINDWMVVVGNIEKIGSDPIETRPIAIDLAAVNPVVDLLPDVGVVFGLTAGYRINENGDILGIYELADGIWGAWFFNPGLYDGDPEVRDLRDGIPQDMSDESPDPLLIPFRGLDLSLNNPVGDSRAQVAGDVDHVPFRYTLGDAEPEWFPEVDLVLWVGGLNDSGTFCGLHRGPKIKGKIKVDPFRFDESLETSLELLPTDNYQQPYGMNSWGDLLTSSYVYRDDWGWVKINDLVVGTDADMQAWSSGNAYVAYQNGINDRGGLSLAGQIAGYFSDGRLFVLTPEPLAPTP